MIDPGTRAWQGKKRGCIRRGREKEGGRISGLCTKGWVKSQSERKQAEKVVVAVRRWGDYS